MRNRSSKSEFLALLTFLILATLVLTNGFAQRMKPGEAVDTFQQIEPVAVVLTEILDKYVYDPDLDHVIEGALAGMMATLDQHSSFIPERALQEMKEDTRGEFEGIGITIKPNDAGEVMVFSPVKGSPAAKAGIKSFDVITAVDGKTAQEMMEEGADDPAFRLLDAMAKRIRGPRGTYVNLTIRRGGDGPGTGEIIEVKVKRAKVPLESIKEARLLDGGIGYIRISDFKDNTARDLEKRLEEFLDQGMRSFVLDLRWNPGGLLTASQQVCELFLPKHSLVTYTRGRKSEDGRPSNDDMVLKTGRSPVLPKEMPMIILVNDQTASSSEIVTGALQFHKRAIVVGEKTYGKGSVQTIIPLARPRNTALRLTTALYYTPADVTINKQGILPDVEEVMDLDEERALYLQMTSTYEDNPELVLLLNHGSVTGDKVIEVPDGPSEEERRVIEEVRKVMGDETADLLAKQGDRLREQKRTKEDRQLRRAVDILRESSVWTELLQKYHRDVHETQMAAETAKRLENKHEAVAKDPEAVTH